MADGASISAAIDNIAAATEKLNETVAEFPDNPILGLTDIGDLLVNSVGVLKTINEGTKVAEASANLTAYVHLTRYFAIPLTDRHQS